MKDIIYIRTSTEDQEPEIQLKAIKEIAPEGCKVFKEKKSAWKKDYARPVFKEIQTLIMRREIKSLYVWDLDRIWRRRKKLINFMQMCKIKGVAVFSYRQTWLNEIQQQEGLFSEMMYDIMLQILGWIAEEESSKKSERIKNAVVKKDGKTRSYKGKTWGRPKTSPETIGKIKRLYDDGFSVCAIQKKLRIGYGTVQRAVQKYKDENLDLFIKES